MLKIYTFMIILFLPVLLLAQVDPPDTLINLSTVNISSERIDLSSVGLVRQTIDSIEKADNPGADLARLLNNSTSVEVRSYGPGTLSTISVRGTSSNHTGLLWNGIRVSPPNIGYLDLSLVHAGFFQHIDLVYGGVSPLYGSGFIGGSIHLNNKPDFGRNNKKFGFTASEGSFGRYNFDGFAGINSEKFYSSTSFALNKSLNDFRYYDLDGNQQNLPHARISGTGLMQDLAYRINKWQYIMGSFWYQSAHREIPPTQTELNSRAVQDDRSARAMLQWKYIRPFGAFDTKVAYLNDYTHFEDPQSLVNSIIKTQTVNLQAGSEIKVIKRSKLYAGINCRHDQADILAYENSKSENVLSLYASWLQEFNKPGWKLSFNLNQDLLGDYHAPLVLSLNADIPVFRSFSAALSASRNFREPTMNERYWQPGGNPELKPEKSWNQELSLMARPVINALKLEFRGTVFNSLVDNWILWLPESSYWTVRNAGRVWARGAELAFRQEFSISQLRISANESYTYTKSTNQKKLFEMDNSFGKQLIYIPLHKVTGRIDLKYRNFRFGLTDNFTSRSYTSSDNSSWLPSFNIINMILATSLIRNNKLNADIQLKINNMFNEEYQVVPYRPMPGLNFLFTIKINFKYEKDEN